MARRYDEKLKARVKAAHAALVARQPEVPALGDQSVADPALRSELLQLVTDCPWPGRHGPVRGRGEVAAMLWTLCLGLSCHARGRARTRIDDPCSPTAAQGCRDVVRFQPGGTRARPWRSRRVGLGVAEGKRAPPPEGAGGNNDGAAA